VLIRVLIQTEKIFLLYSLQRKQPNRVVWNGGGGRHEWGFCVEAIAYPRQIGNLRIFSQVRLITMHKVENY
jgi:hypothetical protein